MMRHGLQIFLAFIALLLTSLTASAQVLPPFSSWVNQRGSSLYVGFVNGNQFSGTFINRASGFQCQGIPYPANGMVYPNGAVTFVVNFTNCDSVTTWTGQVKGSQIPTKWILVYKNKPYMRGTDLFTRQQW